MESPLNVENTFEQNVLYTDIIIIKGIFFGLKSKSEINIQFEKNDLYYQIIPGDKIEFIYNENNKVVINNILERKPFYTIGIIKNIELKENKYEYDFYFPFMFKEFTKKMVKETNIYELKDRIIFYFDENLGMIDIENYGSVENRLNDKKIFIDLYKKYIENNNLIDIKYSNKTFYSTNEIIDLTHLKSFNIDPTHSKDFDDAISVDLENNKIYIHIVDITQMDIGSDMDRNAAHLGFTLYLNEENYNMIDAKYSENEYSLIKNQNRNTVTIEFDLNFEESEENAPLVMNYKIYKSIICIKDRFDYNNIYDFFDKRNDLKLLKDLTEKHYKRFINLPRAEYIINQSTGKINNIFIEDNGTISHQIIEMFMILANKTVVNHLNAFKNTPERFHDRSNNMHLSVFQNRPMEEQLNFIHKLKTAFYDAQKTSHFGLQLKNYCHFTSPIRRYFDIVIHRMLAGYEYIHLKELMEHINNREILNEKIEELYRKWKLMDYLNDHPTQTFQAKVIKVTRKGIKIYIHELGYDTFILLPFILQNIYWKYNEINNSLIGKKNIIEEGKVITAQIRSIDYLSHESINWKIIHI